MSDKRMDAEKAREIVAAFNLWRVDGWPVTPQPYDYELEREARGYLAALEGPEVRALVEAARELHESWVGRMGTTGDQFRKLQDALSAFDKPSREKEKRGEGL